MKDIWSLNVTMFAKDIPALGFIHDHEAHFSVHSTRVARFEDFRDAAKQSNGWYIPAGFATFASFTGGMSDLDILEVHDTLSKETVVFPNREEAARAVWQLAHTKVPVTKSGEIEMIKTVSTKSVKVRSSIRAVAAAAPAASVSEATKKDAAKEAATKKAAAPTKAAAKKAAVTKTAAKAPAKKAATKAPGGGAGRTSKLAGKTIVASVKENPRRPGSHGFNSMNILIKAGAKGITTEEYLKAGGRMNDLNWDIEHGNAKAK